LKRHATRLSDFHALESPRHYPAVVRKQLKRLNRTRLDRLVNRLL
jgi:CDP-diacylglycerol---serine O-phosphatidyltransferase